MRHPGRQSRRGSLLRGNFRTTDRATSVRDLVAESELVIQGVVRSVVATGVVSFPDAGVHIPYRDVAIIVDKQLVGRAVGAPTEIRIRTLGGGMLAIRYEPVFSVGEEVVVFACRETFRLFELPPDTFTVQGLSQGKYTVVRRAGVVLAIRAEDEPMELDALVAELSGWGKRE